MGGGILLTWIKRPLRRLWLLEGSVRQPRRWWKGRRRRRLFQKHGLALSTGAMGNTCFCLLLLLLAPAAKGEVCRSWMSGTPSPLGPFLCPPKDGPPEARFCCGTCGRAFCCASPENCLDQQRCEANITLEEPLEGAPSGQKENATTPTGGDPLLEEIGNYTSLNVTNPNQGDGRNLWSYLWLLPISLGVVLLCLVLFMTVPRLTNRMRILHFLATAHEEQVSSDTSHLPLTRAHAPTPPLRSTVTHVTNSSDARMDADPPSSEVEGLQDTPEIVPGSDNPPKVPSGPPGSGTHEADPIILSAEAPVHTPRPSRKQALIVESYF